MALKTFGSIVLAFCMAGTAPAATGPSAPVPPAVPQTHIAATADSSGEASPMVAVPATVPAPAAVAAPVELLKPAEATTKAAPDVTVPAPIQPAPETMPASDGAMPATVPPVPAVEPARTTAPTIPAPETASTAASGAQKRKLELVPPANYDAVTKALQEQGAALPAGTVASMGFESQTSLVVIVLDAAGQPSRHTYTVVPSVYRWIMAIPELKKGPAADTPPPDRSQEGRLYFITNTALKSLYTYPYSYSTLFSDYDEGSTVMGLSLLTFGAAVYGSYKFTENMKLGYGRVAMMNYGGELALTYAQMMKWMVQSREKPMGHRYYDPYYDDYYYDDYYYEDYYYDPGPTASELTKAWMNILGYPLGIALGAKATYAGNHDYGRVAIMRFLGRSGVMYGLVVPLLFYDNTEYLFETIWGDSYYYSYASEDQRSYSFIASLMGMGLVPLGNYLGYRLTEEHAYSSGRSLLIETTGIMGTITGFLLPTIVESETKNAYLMCGLAGHILGTTIGFNMHKERNYKFNQGAFMALSAVGGAAIALGFPIMVQAESHQAYTMAAIGGGWLGLALGENLSGKIFENSDKDRHALNVELPILWQWPVLASSYAVHRNGRANDTGTAKAEVISVRF